jgi:hypothetical protein
MNVTEEVSAKFGYEHLFTANERYAQLLLGPAECALRLWLCVIGYLKKLAD